MASVTLTLSVDRSIVTEGRACTVTATFVNTTAAAVTILEAGQTIVNYAPKSSDVKTLVGQSLAVGTTTLFYEEMYTSGGKPWNTSGGTPYGGFNSCIYAVSPWFTTSDLESVVSSNTPLVEVVPTRPQNSLPGPGQYSYDFSANTYNPPLNGLI